MNNKLDILFKNDNNLKEIAEESNVVLSYAYDKEKNVGEDCRRIVVKIYDHFQLVSCQIESANNIFTNSVEDTKINLRNEVKGIEKEHISILGIFASIVLAFVGGITFSTSVLQNIGSVSIYRLLLVIDLLAFVMINTIFILVRFIFEINDKDVSKFKISWINGAVITFAVVIVTCWIIQIDKMPEFIAEMLPWG